MRGAAPRKRISTTCLWVICLCAGEHLLFAAAVTKPHGWARGTARRAGRGGRAGTGAGGAHSLASEEAIRPPAKQGGEGETEAENPGFFGVGNEAVAADHRAFCEEMGLAGEHATDAEIKSFSVKKLKRYITYYGQSNWRGQASKRRISSRACTKSATVSANGRSQRRALRDGSPSSRAKPPARRDAEEIRAATEGPEQPHGRLGQGAGAHRGL